MVLYVCMEFEYIKISFQMGLFVYMKLNTCKDKKFLLNINYYWVVQLVG